MRTNIMGVAELETLLQALHQAGGSSP
jgi:hypothetical protein